MGRQLNRLNPMQVQKQKKPGRYADGGNLYFLVGKDGSRRWVFIYRNRQTGKQREMGLGNLVSVPLKRARELAADYRLMIADGIDPLAERQAEQVTIPSFTSCAAMFIRAHRRGWKNYKHRMQWITTLKTYAVPVMGAKLVDEITTEDILQILQPIWTGKTETAKRVQGRIENILDFAAARKWRDQSNPARWRGHLDMLLPKPGRVKTVIHHPAMPHDELPAFMGELRGNDSLSSKALQWLILTATRTSETIRAQWDEIELKAGVWTIPANRMKTRQEHRVPLSEPLLQILEKLPQTVGNPYLFPGTQYGKPLSNMAMLQLMRGLGFGNDCPRGSYVPHGFRSSFRDWAGETTPFPRDVVEMALAHAIQNKVEAAYRRDDLFEKRRALMSAWANWCGKSQGVVVPLRAGEE